jgi:LysM repeat protein
VRRSVLAIAGAVTVVFATIAVVLSLFSQAEPVLAATTSHVTWGHSVGSEAASNPAEPLTYTVKQGDTLSSIAAKQYGNFDLWPDLWAGNKIKNPDVIIVGQVLALSSDHPYSAKLTSEAMSAIPKPKVVLTSDTQPSAESAPADVVAQPQTSLVQPTGSSFEQCVIERESGGNPQVMNSTGHYGLFQFDYGTWVSGGGNPADFGHASVAEQEQVFASVYAARGTEPWAPSDGC